MAPAAPGPLDLAAIDQAPRPAIFAKRDYPAGHRFAPHSHGRDQLLFAGAGVMTVRTEAGTWVVPPLRAVWIPAGVVHEVAAGGPVSLRNIYLDPAAYGGLPRDCAVVTVSPLLRELILAAVELSPDYDQDGPAGRLVATLIDQIRAIDRAPLHLPRPRDRRLALIAKGLDDNPADARSLAQWGRQVGAGGRTLARLFVAETGMTFGQWRAQFRLLKALERLAEGAAASAVAHDLGYASQSAFIAMFRRTLGTTPGRYFQDGGA